MQLAHAALAETILLLEGGIKKSNRPEDRAIVARYLAELAPMLAAAVLGQDIVRDLAQFERTLGHTWLVDQEPFAPGLVKWREFRVEYETQALGSMTIRERMYALGVLQAFDQALERGDRSSLVHLLRQARVDDTTAAAILQRCSDSGNA